MKSAIALAVTAVAFVNAGSLLRPRGLEELWGNINITAAALEIAGAVSGPTCNATQNCQDFLTKVIPQCMKLQGTAGCWCTLHDPLHYCAICMSSPTDNTTTAEQTQASGEGHTNYHRGCAAYQTYLNASAAGSLSSSGVPATSAPLPTGTAASSNSGGSHLSTGAIVGIAVGGAILLAVIGAATYLMGKCMKRPAAVTPLVAGPSEKRQDSMPVTSPVHVTSYYDGSPNTTAPLMAYQQQQQGYPHQPPSPNPTPNPFGTNSMYSAQRDSMYTDAGQSYNPAMRNAGPGSDYGGSSQGGRALSQPGVAPDQMGPPPQHFHVANDMDAQRNMVGSPPPPFSPHPEGYDTSLLAGVSVPRPGTDTKARYQ